MSDTAASNVERAPGWQLLADFAAANLLGDRGQLADQVTEAVQNLRLQPSQLERIHQAFVEAVNRASRDGLPNWSVLVRIWVLGDCDGRGWSFFLVEKHGHNSQSTSNDSDHLMELFLYQERDS